MVRDLLCGFMPGAGVRELDLGTLERASGSYFSDDLRDRADDIIWRVRWGQDWRKVEKPRAIGCSAKSAPASALRLRTGVPHGSRASATSARWKSWVTSCSSSPRATPGCARSARSARIQPSTERLPVARRPMGQAASSTA